MFPWFRPLRKGQQLSAEQYNRMADQVAASANMTVAWPLNLETGLHGTHLSIDIPKFQLCRVVSVAAPSTNELPVYTVLPVYDQIITSSLAPFASDSPEPTMTAYEINSSPSVPVDGTALVWCWLSDNTGYWNFDYSSRGVVFAEITSCSIESAGHKHAWTEKRRNADGEWEDVPNGFSGTEENNQLVEINNRGGTRVGTIVVAWRGYSSGRCWVRVAEVSQPPTSTNEVQSVTVYNASGGTFTLTFNNNGTTATTAPIPYDADVTVLKSYLDALPNITSVTVTGVGTEASPFLVTFTDSVAIYPLMTVDYSLLKGSQEWLFEQPQNKFWARITRVTSASCGVSGSGADTTHTVHTYHVHSIRDVDDGDGCATTILDEIDVAITGTAYERNNNLVAVGTNVEVESVTYTDESQSGSGTSNVGPAGCRLVFSHEVHVPLEPDIPPPSFRYLCENENGDPSDVQTEWLVGKNGVLTYLRDTEVCCGCASGSGSGCTCTWFDSVPTNICFTLHITSHPVCFGGSVDIKVRLINTINTPTVARWDGTSWDFDAGTTTPTFIECYFDSTSCKIFWHFSGSHNHACPDAPSRAVGFHVSWVTDCPPTFPHEIANVCTVQSDVEGGTLCGDTATIAEGACDDDESGSGDPGECPCSWLHNGVSWNQTGGPAMGGPGGCASPLFNGSLGEIAHTNLDGSECDPDDGPPCGDCGSADRTVTFTNATGWLADATPPAFTFAKEPGGPIWTNGFITACGVTANCTWWCEDGTWYFGIVGAGMAVAAEPGGTCASMTFILDLGTDNILCPGQSASATVTVTT